MVGLAVAQGVIRLEGAIVTAREAFDSSYPAVAECVATLQEVINGHASPLLAHAMWLAVGHFNDLSVKRRRKLAHAIHDPQLAKWLEDS